ncbi:hypothetical protein [Beijerinckia indica]|uniref:Uncharacterized protein n=1 Tax=Beijerinckia indica subsp. indica (strain ATCC 9039 / DSM 1715 / NCIMB 8712) TaxID=395963 RepID=B2IH30_BEII9|nr:hypothetical protein [Beijerinckia indica]ACB94444.1 hypothetical protein Bind_0794 [Beijerinckia indica subsp. indica ATCC 9039]
MLERDTFFTDINAVISEFDEQLGPRPAARERLERVQSQARCSARIAAKKRAEAFINNPLLLELIQKDLSRADAQGLIATARKLLATKTARHGRISVGGNTSLINVNALILYGRWMRFVERRLVYLPAPDMITDQS